MISANTWQRGLAADAWVHHLAYQHTALPQRGFPCTDSFLSLHRHHLTGSNNELCLAEGSGAETWWAQSQAPQVCHSSTLSAHRSSPSGGIASQPRLPCMGFLCPGWMHSEYTGGALGSPAGGFVGPVCKLSWHSTSVKSLGEKLQASVNS